MTTTLYIICVILLLWLIGVDVRYYQINKKIKIMHETDKNLYELIQTSWKANLHNATKVENEKNKKKDKQTKVVKKRKRVRVAKKSSNISKAKISKS